MTRFGRAKARPASVAMVVGGPGTGPAGPSATNALHLSTQVPRMPFMAVVGRVPKGVAGVCFSARSNLRRRELTPIEVAVLEVLRDYPAYVEAPWPEVVARLTSLADEGRIDLARLVSVAAAERRPGLRGRVRELLDA